MPKQPLPARARATKDPRRRSGSVVRTARSGPEPRRGLPLGPALRAQQERQLARRLAPHLSGALDLTITDNRAVMISVQRDLRRRRFRVRLHHLFVDAPDGVLQQLARYVAFNDSAASRALNAFIDERQDRIRPRRADPEPAAKIHTRGKVHDLREIFDKLNAAYFDGQVTARITWGRNVRRGKSRRSIKVGSYCLEQDTIRIHPGLDQEWVPDYYVRWVVFHEMLHSVHPIPTVNGRRKFHTPEFARDERRFADHDRALVWEQRNLAALLCI